MTKKAYNDWPHMPLYTAVPAGSGALMRIANTVETSEVPVALYNHILSGKLEIGMELAAIGAVVSLIS